MNELSCHSHRYKNAVCAAKNVFSLKNWLLSYDLIVGNDRNNLNNNDDDDDEDNSGALIPYSPEEATHDGDYSHEESNFSFNQITNVFVSLNNVIVNVF